MENDQSGKGLQLEEISYRELPRPTGLTGLTGLTRLMGLTGLAGLAGLTGLAGSTELTGLIRGAFCMAKTMLNASDARLVYAKWSRNQYMTVFTMNLTGFAYTYLRKPLFYIRFSMFVKQSLVSSTPNARSLRI